MGVEDCTGHFGHLELSVPLYNILFITRVKQILECICHRCFNLRIDQDSHKSILYKKSSVRKVWNSSKIKDCCATCGELIKKISLKNFSLFWGDGHQLYAKEAFTILSKLSLETVAQLGITYHPSNLIFTIFPIPPPVVRPTVVFGKEVREDDLTYKLKEIIKYNNKYKLVSNNYHLDILQSSVNAYYDVKATTTSGFQPNLKSLKSLKCRLKGKTGRMRNNIQGKRVDFSGRDVITGDPTLKLQELGVPLQIAMNLTFPEPVTEYNISTLQDYVSKGWNKKWKRKTDEDTLAVLASIPQHFSDYLESICVKLYKNRENIQNYLSTDYDHIISNYLLGEIKEINAKQRKTLTLKIIHKLYTITHSPIHVGANTVIKRDQDTMEELCRIPLQHCKECPVIRVGDVVERHLRDGDWCVFNRQPTLHRMGFMGHRIKVMPGKTFRINVLVATSYNADFDGDGKELYLVSSE